MKTWRWILAALAFASPASAANLRIMNVGVGTGTVANAAAGISCTTGVCNFSPPAAPLTLTATAGSGFRFVRWWGDCASFTTSSTCTLDMSSNRAVRAEFSFDPEPPLISDFTPEGIQAYLDAHLDIDTAAEFVHVLPPDFKQNWILMSRSESLQTGIAAMPRILLPNESATAVFTIALDNHSAYPGAHQNAIEYMQWDGRATEKNFRFHEIILNNIPDLFTTPPPSPPTHPSQLAVAARTRRVSPDDARCFQCHSTRNVFNRLGTANGTTGIPAGTVKWKNKPNWDAYDSWGGMMPFNRDRIYKGSVEAAAFRKLLNPWTWSTRPDIRAIIEQLELQPSTHAADLPSRDVIQRKDGEPDDGYILFEFDGGAIVTPEPAPAGTATENIGYNFDGTSGPGTTTVQRGGDYVLLQHSSSFALDPEEGRGVEFFDRLGGLDGDINAQRIADEVINHKFATGSFPIDVRPITLAITKGCITLANLSTFTHNTDFFTQRNGITSITDLRVDTENRQKMLPRRKADIQKRNVDRTNDPYLILPTNGLLAEYGALASIPGTDTDKARQEVFRRPIETGFGQPDITGATVLNGKYVDREFYNPNTEKLTLYRYFLEPLGVSVDKWSMSVRGRSRAYNFADVFDRYLRRLEDELRDSLAAESFPGVSTPFTCNATFLTATSNSLSALPGTDDVPKYTDVQRIFNKACIECHGGLRYPPFDRYFSTEFDLSEDETATAGSRLTRSYNRLTAPGYLLAAAGSPVEDSYLYQRITLGNENCPGGIMPCGGPALSKADVETLKRWINGTRAFTEGDPHIQTVDGEHYDFQSAGEFVLLRDEELEIQTRQTPVETQIPLGPNDHTGLTTCVSINTAAAFRVGQHRVTYQPNINGRPDPEGLQLRVDGKLTAMSDRGVILRGGGRILRTTAPGGIQIEYPGGTDILVTPGWWPDHQVWYLTIDVRHTRATDGIMGAIAPGNWLPALPDGTFMGPRPTPLYQRYQELYVRFADAWRVQGQNSLFDYAPGTSSGTFTLASWPGFSPQTCNVPPMPLQPVVKPIRPLPIELARQHCRGIVSALRRANCEQDVMVTGHPGFAETYLRAQAIVRNAAPSVPILLSPDKDQIDLPTSVSFQWRKTADPNRDRLVYMQCVWELGSTLTFDNCRELPRYATILDGRNLNIVYLLLLLALLIVIFLFMRWKRLRILLLLLILLILILAFLVYHYGTARTLTYEWTGLKPGTSYYWKVIAQDGKGGTVSSELRRFAVKP